MVPIPLVDMKTLRAWECLASDTGEDLVEAVRKYHLQDFSNWKNHAARRLRPAGKFFAHEPRQMKRSAAFTPLHLPHASTLEKFQRFPPSVR